MSLQVINAYERSQRSVGIKFGGSMSEVSIVLFGNRSVTNLEFWVKPLVDPTNMAICTLAPDIGPTKLWYFTSPTNIRHEVVGTETKDFTIPDVSNRWSHIKLVSYSTSSPGVASFARVYFNGVLISEQSLTALNSQINNIDLGVVTGKTDLNCEFAELKTYNSVSTLEDEQLDVFNYYNRAKFLNYANRRTPLNLFNESYIVPFLYFPLTEGNGDFTEISGIGGFTIITGTVEWLTGVDPILYDRTYKGSLSKFTSNKIQKNVNNGVSSMVFTVPNVKGNDNDLVFKKDAVIEIDLKYSNKSTGRTIFNGVSKIQKFRPKNTKKVEITCLSIISELSNFTPTDGDNYIFTYSSLPIEECFKRLIDSYNGQSPLVALKYTDDSIEATGKNITIGFGNDKSFLTAFARVWDHTDDRWYWFIDETNTFFLRQVSSTSDYIFSYGRDFLKASKDVDATEVVNEVKISNGDSIPNFNNRYINSNSIGKYGAQQEIILDERYSEAGGNEAALRRLARNDSPNISIDAIIKDVAVGGQYDITKINPGATFSVVNTDEQLNDLIITTIEFDPSRSVAKITAGDRETYVSRELNDIKDKQFQSQSSKLPNLWNDVNITTSGFDLVSGESFLLANGDNFELINN